MTQDFEYLKANLENVRERVKQAAIRSGRTEKDIKIVAVTKTVNTDVIQKALEYGVTDIGENKVQEILEKQDIIKAECNWHLIGHLQRNKVKYIIDKVAMIHSLDSVELAAEINKRACAAGRVMDVLVQVNVSGEETKHGISPVEVSDFLKKVSVFKNIKVRGLMTMAPYADKESVRPVFRTLKKISVDIANENIDNINMEYLSMGMSNDFEVAIEEGANIVRIGTAIFGQRNYQ